MRTEKPVTIEVTQEDIDNGVRGNCSKCPIALAANRAFPYEMIMTSYSLYETTDKRRSEYLSMNVPQEAAKFVKKFDDGEQVHPFTFEVIPTYYGGL